VIAIGNDIGIAIEGQERRKRLRALNDISAE